MDMELKDKGREWMELIRGNDELQEISTTSLLFSHLAIAEILNSFLSFNMIRIRKKSITRSHRGLIFFFFQNKLSMSLICITPCDLEHWRAELFGNVLVQIC